LEYIKVKNLAVHYVKATSKKKQEIPLLFIHGANGNASYMVNYMNYFSDAGYDTYAVNLRGHHPSDREAALGRVTVQDYADDVKNVMKSLQIENAVLIGHSMGGLIAQMAAAQMQKISALIVIASAPPSGFCLLPPAYYWLLNEFTNSFPIPPMMRPSRLKRYFSLFTVFLTSLNGLIGNKLIRPNYPIVAELFLNNVANEEKKSVYSALVPESYTVAFQIAKGVSVDVDSIQCPKLVIVGKRDLMAFEALQKRLAEYLNADFIAYDRLSHLLMIEKGWEKPAMDIQSWLEKKVA
jgi:pimeloyl-ACP methyl ester carboxylesterase